MKPKKWKRKEYHFFGFRNVLSKIFDWKVFFRKLFMKLALDILANKDFHDSRQHIEIVDGGNMV